MPPRPDASIRARILTHLMRSILHDVNNSLTAIGLAAEFALRKQDAETSATALERAVAATQAQRRQLDSVALLLSDHAEPEGTGPVSLAELVADLAALCSAACLHDIHVVDHSDNMAVQSRPAELALLITACLLDASVREGDVDVQIEIDPQDDEFLLMSLSGQGMHHGGVFDPQDMPIAGLEALSSAADCTLIWQPDKCLSGLRVALLSL